jgi:hypothetical protein
MMAKRKPAKKAANAPAAPTTASVCKTIADLIQRGNNLPVVPGSDMPDPTSLAQWYASCAGLSASLTALIGDSNVWKATLTGGNPGNDDQTQMLGTLQAIQQFLNCP